MASLGDLDGRMHGERWGDSFEEGQNRKWTDWSHSLAQQINHSLFVRSSEGGEVGRGDILWEVSFSQFAADGGGGMALLSWGRLSL